LEIPYFTVRVIVAYTENAFNERDFTEEEQLYDSNVNV